MYVDLVRGPRTKPTTVALFNNPAVLTKTGLSGCCGSLSIDTCTPQGPATPKAPGLRGDGSARNAHGFSQRLRPALVLPRTPGEESARQQMSTLPGEPGRILVPAHLAEFMDRLGTWTINYCYAERSRLTQSTRSTALGAGAEVPPLQTSTA